MSHIDSPSGQIRITRVRWRAGTIARPDSQIVARVPKKYHEAARLIFEAGELVAWGVESNGRAYRGEALPLAWKIDGDPVGRTWMTMTLRVTGPIRSRRAPRRKR